MRRFRIALNSSTTNDRSWNTAEGRCLLEPFPFPWIEPNRSEVHVDNICHIQHSAAQMILSLRLRGTEPFPWFRLG